MNYNHKPAPGMHEDENGNYCPSPIKILYTNQKLIEATHNAMRTRQEKQITLDSKVDSN